MSFLHILILCLHFLFLLEPFSTPSVLAFPRALSNFPYFLNTPNARLELEKRQEDGSQPTKPCQQRIILNELTDRARKLSFPPQQSVRGMILRC